MAVAIVQSKYVTNNSARTVSITFDNTPAAGSVVFLFSSCTNQGQPITTPAGWTNVLGGNTHIETDSHEMTVLWHVVTPAEFAANTKTFTATLLYNVPNIFGTVLGMEISGLDTTTPVSAVATDAQSANLATPHVLIGVASGSVTINGGTVLSCVVADSSGSVYPTVTGWTRVATSDTTQSKAVYIRDALTTAGVAVASQNVTPAAADEYISYTLILKPGASTTVGGYWGLRAA